MMRYSKKEIFSIPNILSYIRLALIPIFVHVYLNVETASFHLISTCILAFASISDFLDGKIARSFNMITDLGKILDPIADKIYQFTLAAVLMYHYPLMGIVIAIMAIEDAMLLFFGYYVYAQYQRHIPQAKMPGKIASAVYFVFTIFLAAFDLTGSIVSIIMIAMMTILMAYACMSYGLELFNYYKQGKAIGNGQS